MIRVKPHPESIAAAEEDFALAIGQAEMFARRVIDRNGSAPNGQPGVKAYRLALIRLSEIKLLVE